MCIWFTKCFAKILRHRHFELAPLQTEWVQAYPEMNITNPPKEMVVLTSSGEIYGGADAIVFLSQRIWWAWPVYLFSKLPGVMFLLRTGYQWVADHRKCGTKNSSCKLDRCESNEEIN